MKEADYLLWLSRIERLGAKRQRILLDHFSSAEAVFHASPSALSEISGITGQNTQHILSKQNEQTIYSYLNELESKDIQFITLFDQDYPFLLSQIDDPPLGIYVLGTLPPDSLLKISIIGARKCTEYGRTASYKLSKDLAGQDAVIVSGMARGIDSMAHQGALEGGGLTIAVLGCGVDICYPSENRLLRDKIIQNGCVLSEFPPGTQPRPGFFRIRNRIISGLSEGTIVIEAAEKSGTRITAGQALDQGRQVMAVPGSIFSKLSRGTHELIQDGAALISDYKDVLDTLGIYMGNRNKSTENSKNNACSSLAPEEKLVYDCINFDPVTVDEIVRKLHSQVQVVNYILTMLEINGYVQKLPGQKYIRSL